jgi:hypothetical protein
LKFLYRPDTEYNFNTGTGNLNYTTNLKTKFESYKIYRVSQNSRNNVVFRGFTRSSWIPGCRKLIQERGNIRGEVEYRGNGGIGGRKPRRCERFKGAILENLAVLGVD